MSEAHEEALGRLAADVLDLLERGATPDARTLAARHGVALDAARRCVEGALAMERLCSGDEPAAAPPAPALPAPYEVIELVGSGAAGVVSRAGRRRCAASYAKRARSRGSVGSGRWWCGWTTPTGERTPWASCVTCSPDPSSVALCWC